MKTDSWLKFGFLPICLWASNISELLQHCFFALHAGCSFHVIFGSFVSTFFWSNEQLANMHPVIAAFYHCLVWLVTDRGGDKADCDKVTDWYWQTGKQSDRVKEGHRVSKAVRGSLTYSWGLFRLVSLTFALSDDNWTHAPPPHAAMEVLVSELGVLLKMLDQENLSSSTQEKKTSVWRLLQQIQPSG